MKVHNFQTCTKPMGAVAKKLKFKQEEDNNGATINHHHHLPLPLPGAETSSRVCSHIGLKCKWGGVDIIQGISNTDCQFLQLCLFLSPSNPNTQDDKMARTHRSTQGRIQEYCRNLLAFFFKCTSQGTIWGGNIVQQNIQTEIIVCTLNGDFV